MATINSILFHGYIYGTAFWYALRGSCRIYDPEMVLGWHRPPIQRNLAPNDLEKYHAWTDGWCLVALALFLLSTNGAVASSAPAATPTAKTNAWYAKAAVAITLLHHVTTGYGAYQHYRLETHYNTAMGIGVWGNVWLTLVGVVTLVGLLTGQGNREVGRELKTK